MVEGEIPTSDKEIALGIRIKEELRGLSLGDTITIEIIGSFETT